MQTGSKFQLHRPFLATLQSSDAIDSSTYRTHVAHLAKRCKLVDYETKPRNEQNSPSLRSVSRVVYQTNHEELGIGSKVDYAQSLLCARQVGHASFSLVINGWTLPQLANFCCVQFARSQSSGNNCCERKRCSTISTIGRVEIKLPTAARR